MGAKDTIIKRKVNWITFNRANLEKLLLEQAEVSYKAGQGQIIARLALIEKQARDPWEFNKNVREFISINSKSG